MNVLFFGEIEFPGTILELAEKLDAQQNSDLFLPRFVEENKLTYAFSTDIFNLNQYSSFGMWL